LGLHLPHNAAAVDLHGCLPNLKGEGDLFVQLSRDNLQQHFTFAGSQGGVALAQRS
jgi:hypothetical protein